MPKRSCPFGVGAPLQLKTRVGLRELSRGVRGEEYRREVFGEGLDLCFADGFGNCCMYGLRDGLSAVLPLNKKRTNKAVSGGPCAGAPKCVPQSAATCSSVPPVGVSKACSSCVRTADVKEACTQCDQFVCQNCSRLCSCCNAVTCSLCSTIDYGDVGEQVLCNGCSIFQV
ncbi:Apoptosis regulatory protein Siva, partial [Eudyptes sclateri]